MKNKLILTLTTIIMAFVFIIIPSTQSYASDEFDLMKQYEDMTGLDFKKVEEAGQSIMNYKPMTVKIYNKLKELHKKSKNASMTKSLNITFISLLSVFILYATIITIKELCI